MMKTEKEITSEIASDVRKATRQRAEAELAEERALKRELEKEERAYKRIQKQKIADYLFKLSIVFATSSAITCLSLYIKDSDANINWAPAILGGLLSILLAFYAIYILKH